MVLAWCPSRLDLWSFNLPKVLGLLMNPAVVSQESISPQIKSHNLCISALPQCPQPHPHLLLCWAVPVGDHGFLSPAPMSF